MNLVAFGLILICCNAWAIETDGYQKYARTKFEDFLERCKEILKTGNDTLGIPVLDPFTVDQLPIKLNEEMIDLDALLTNVNVDGLSAYNVNNGDFKLIGVKLIMNLTWPLIIASTNYAMKGRADEFEIYGNGEINLSVKDFSFATEISFTINGQHLKVKQMQSKLFLRALDFRATGLFDDEELSELLSAVISDMVPQLIDDYQDTIAENVNNIVTDKLDDFLDTMTLGDLLKLIGL